MSNRFYANAGHFYAPHVMPILMDCNFTVAVTDTGGLGITGLTGNGVNAVFMHTSATPAATNPNPASGYIMVQLSDNYNAIYGFDFHLTSPGSGSSVAIDLSDALLTVGQPYQILTVGTSTLADWVTVGLPKGLTPTIGQAFVAKATGAGVGSGTVQLPKATGSGIDHIEMIGLPATSLAPVGLAVTPGTGAIILLQCLGATNSSTTTFIKTAPADGTLIGLRFYLGGSSAKG